jgi:1-deoxy-D-xylulose-5-phosphate synthase
MHELLDRISSPADLKKLAPAELAKLAEEIRALIIDVVSRNGGHLSSNLGAVELTIALHYVFDAPRDKIIWDVGHQAYTHKILTGRRERFGGLRQRDGILGFPAREESEYDAYNTGHASTALSAALGFAVARDKAKEKHKVIAVVGDGSLTGGIAWEALNQIGHLRPEMTIILNDNEMSISQSVGAISKYLSYLASGQHYLKIKDLTKSILKSVPALGWPVIRAGRAVEDMIKKTFFPGLVFEELGLRYIGPVQAHNVESLLEVFEEARRYEKGPILIHCVTSKGKGYAPAQNSPDRFHGASPFEVGTGEPKAAPARESYSAAFGRTMIKIGRADPKVIAITAAMSEGTGLHEFARTLPGQFFDVGIAEQHAVTFAAGMAVGGLKPVCAIYSTFLQRAYDQVYHDVCLQNLPVVFALDRAGVVPDDGPTHQGINDISYLRPMPNMVLMAPRDENEFQHMLAAALGYGRPAAIRFPKDQVTGVAMDAEFKPVPVGKSERLKEGRDLVFAYGSLVLPALEAARTLEAEGISLAVVDAKFAKPLDEEAILEYAGAGRAIAVVEEGVCAGGLGSAVRELIDGRGLFGVRFLEVGLPIEPYPVGKTSQIKRSLRLDAEGLAARFREFFA